MGIKDLYKLFYDLCPNVFIKMDLYHFHSKKIGWDISSYIIASKVKGISTWKNQIINRIIVAKENNVHILPVFDGKAPMEKDEERKRRRDEQAKRANKVNLVEQQLKEYIKDDTVIGKELSDVWKQKTKKGQEGPSKANRLLGRTVSEENEIIEENGTLVEEKLVIDTEVIESYIKKSREQNVAITKEDVQTLKELFDVFKIPYVQAPGEAEACAAYLESIGEISAVLSEDSDVLAYGAKILLNELNNSSGTMRAVHLDDVLYALGLKHEEFLDLCVMCGTDYNKNIKGVGGKTVYNYIYECRSIEKIEEKYKLDTTILKYKRSRELFQKFGDIDLSACRAEYWDVQIDIEEVVRFCKENKIFVDTKILKKLWKPATFEIVKKRN